MKRQSLQKSILLVLALALGLGLAPALWGHGDQSHWRAPEAAQKVKNPVPPNPESLARGKELYRQVCLVCHGEKGDGKGPAGAGLNPRPADFTAAAMMKEMSDGELFWKLSQGKGPMPSYEKQFSETDRWNLVNYLRTFAGVGKAPTEEGKVIYTCPMHPEVSSDKPGKCPKCGMNLVPKQPPAPQLPKTESEHQPHSQEHCCPGKEPH